MERNDDSRKYRVTNVGWVPRGGPSMPPEDGDIIYDDSNREIDDDSRNAEESNDNRIGHQQHL